MLSLTIRRFIASAGTHKGVLAGIRVIDFSRLLPGPWCSQILRDMGAEVIRIEEPKPNGGDNLRTMAPLCSDGVSLLFHQVNRGKKSVSLDWKLTEGRERLHQLISTADVLLEQSRPGIMRKYGFDAEEMLKLYPKLVYCSITGYGQNGPSAWEAAHDLNLASRAGLYEGIQRPLPYQVAGGSLPAAMNIIAALMERNKTGMGCHIDCAIVQGAYSLMPTRTLPEGTPAIRESPSVPLGTTCSYNMYRTKDSVLAVGSLETKYFSKFLNAIGVDDTKNVGNVSIDKEPEAAHLYNKIQEVLLSKTTDEWMAALNGSDACVSPVTMSSQAAEDAQLKHRGVTIDVTIPTGTTLPLVRTPVYLPGSEVPIEPAPTVGQNNAEFFTN